MSKKILRGIRGVARRLLVLASAVLISGCALYSNDGGFDVVQSETRERLGQEARWLKDEANRAAARAEVDERLKKALTAEDAMQIALLNNAALQVAYANLGVTESDRVQAGRLPNPGFSFSKTTGGGAQEIEKGLSFQVAALLTMPIRVAMETRRFEAAKLAAAADTADTALQARRAYFQAVAARQQTEYMRQVVDAALASRDLMNRMARVGTSSKLELAREELFLAESRISLARALQQESASREALIRMLGLWGEQLSFQLPDRLPELPPAPQEIADIEQTALEQRLDVRMSRGALDNLSKSLELTSAVHFINLLEEAGPVQVRERGEATRNGYEIGLEIPIFDLGDAKVSRAQALYNQGVHRLREVAVNARSQVRENYQAYRTAYDVAKHYRDEVVPLRSEISAEQLLRYNGMLTGVFELIADARDQVASVSEYLRALEDFWVTDTALQSAMLGTGSMSAARGGDDPAMPSGGGEH